MSYSLRLERDGLALSLNGVELDGVGVQAGPGAAGLGAPPISVQWVEGIIDGGRPTSTRYPRRTIDLPINIVGTDLADVEARYRALMTMVSRTCSLFAKEDTLRGGETALREYELRVQFTGGLNYQTGTDSSGPVLSTVLTFDTVGNPHWASTTVSTHSWTIPVGSFITSLFDFPLDSEAPTLINWRFTANLASFSRVSVFIDRSRGTIFPPTDAPGVSIMALPVSTSSDIVFDMENRKVFDGVSGANLLRYFTPSAYAGGDWSPYDPITPPMMRLVARTHGGDGTTAEVTIVASWRNRVYGIVA